MTEDKRRQQDRTGERYDTLTGIYSRTGFYEATDRLLKEHPEEIFVIAYWNVQKFKVINELFGRDIGDQILRHMAGRMKQAVEDMERLYTYGRLERDNFVMCFPRRFIQLKSFVHSGEISYEREGVEYHFTSCFGLYEVKDRDLTVAAMVDRSRIAMETVKQNYVQPFAYYNEEMRDHMVMEQIMMSDCRRAIKEEQFKVYYQPVCDASDGRIVSAEALVRWLHPDKGLIPPSEFIPVFEKNGFISLLDRYVWKQACRVLSEREKQGAKRVPISVNVSRVEFYHSALCDDLGRMVREYPVDPGFLPLEVTESAYSDNPGRVVETVKSLQALGFPILMDDFGSGYSSLNTLKDLPVDILKIDMRFMDRLDADEKSAIILESVVQMAKRMRLKIIAEGVEKENELRFLRGIACDYIQGYYFYRPLPEREFVALLDRDELVADATV